MLNTQRLALLATCLCLASVAHASWPQFIVGPANGFDGGLAITHDSAGNVYVTGQVYSGALEQSDVITTKYNRSGILKWSRVWDSVQHGNEAGRGVTVDSTGTVYVVGTSDGLGDNDIVVLAYTASGTLKPPRIVPGTENNPSVSPVITRDANDNVAIAYTLQTGAATSQIAVLCLDTEAQPKWSATFEGTDPGWNTPYAVAFDSTGSLVVVGETYNGPNYYDYVTIKYRPNGQRRWFRTHDGADSRDAATSVAIDTDDSIVVTGTSDGTSGTTDVVTLKYRPTSGTIWKIRTGASGLHESATKVVLASNGDPVIVGTVGPDSTATNIYTLRLRGSDGAKLWSRSYSSAPANNSPDKGIDLGIDSTGQILVLGSLVAGNTAEGTKYCLIRYDAAGTLISGKRYSKTPAGSSYPTAMTVDPAVDKAYITGYAYDPTTYYDAATIRM